MAFKDKMFEGRKMGLDRKVNIMWEEIANSIKKVAMDLLGESNENDHSARKLGGGMTKFS